MREGAIAALNANTNRYSDSVGLRPLRKAVAERLAAESSIGWNTEDIVIAASANEALLDAALAVLDPGDEAIIIRPCWPTFPLQVLLAGATPVFVDARRLRYVPDISSIRAAVTPRTKAIVINSPNNPTGAVYDRTTLQNIGEFAISSQLWIISDERYSRFVFTGARYESIVTTLPDVRSRTIVVNAFSNELAITGWCLGYFAAPAEIVFAARTLQSHITANPNVIAQHAILHHLQVNDGSFERELHQRLANARDIGLHILSDLRDVAMPRPMAHSSFYLDLSRLISALRTEGPIRSTEDIARLLLDEANVGCVSGGAFGDVNGLRLSFGAPPDLLETGLKHIVGTLNSLRTRQVGI
ncbi:aminotransferase class I/II-fold pyridoxal phosphate-dependent enzyme [Bradyrhizobium australiense]|uniref:aminotransferase class I/II-fold pyridoxal phosphate-dependent enzyme n=1 Tax=Bradyrhizobium australiense TaxID=2721161 RepID=UPI00289B597B|nr:aminotransferase class I/II-fold pyridoxal phosphate-dependent enzyme [Bradyrhizobium australiense]